MKADPKLTLIATPVYDHKVELAFIAPLMELTRVGKIGPHLFVPGDSDIRHARNKIANFFITQHRFNELIFIDADMGFDISDWVRLTDDYPEPVVHAVYSRKAHGSPPSNGLGFCRIHREVFEAMKAECSVYQDENNEPCHDFFGMHIIDGKWVSESVGFWRILSELRVPMRVIASPTIVHYGRAAYTLSQESVTL